VFLRPVVVRDEATSATVATNRYDYMRTQTTDAQKPDNWVLRGYEGAQLPPAGSVPSPAQRQPGIEYPVPRSAPAAPAPAPAPQGSVPPASAAPASGSFAASASSPPVPAGSRVQLLQVAAGTDVAKGRELTKQLREAGFDAYWESVREPGRNDEVVRVRVSVDRATQNVPATIAELKQRGFDAVPVTP
jgi:cell division septation protein DedD